MADGESSEYARRMHLLRIEHRDLDDAIEAMRISPARDEIQLARLKKRKLLLKDEISRLQDQNIPDIIA